MYLALAQSRRPQGFPGAVGIGPTWRIVKASWRYLASLRLAGDPVASGVLGVGLGLARFR